MTNEEFTSEMDDEEAKAKLEVVLQKALSPSEDELRRIYDYWGRFSRWTIKEAAALVIEADPSVIIAYRYWPAEPQYAFDGFENILRRNFGTDLAPAALRKYGPRIGIENTLLWSAIEHTLFTVHTSQDNPLKRWSGTRWRICFSACLCDMVTLLSILALESRKVHAALDVGRIAGGRRTILKHLEKNRHEKATS